jgi:hypothetical protein
MEAVRSSETSAATQRTTRRHIPEDDTLHNHRCENLKSYKKDFTVSLKISESNTLPVLAELISSTLKMEAICSSETSVLVQRKLSRKSRI